MAASYSDTFVLGNNSNVTLRIAFETQTSYSKPFRPVTSCIPSSQQSLSPAALTIDTCITINPVPQPEATLQPVPSTQSSAMVSKGVGAKHGTTSKPPIVLLIHGAWHTPVHYYPLSHSLTTSGFTTICPPLPTCSNVASPTATLQSDITYIHNIASDLAAKGHPIIATMHSYGGVVGTEALAGLGWAERAQHQQPGGVVSLIYMCSFVLSIGESLCTPFGGQLPPIMVDYGDGFCDMDDRWLRFFSADVAGTPPPATNDCAASARKQAPQSSPPATSALNPPTLPPPDLTYLLSNLTKHPTSSQMTPITAAAYLSPDIHVAYLVCERDVALPPFVQRGMVEQVRALGVDVVVESCDGGHSPFLSVPGEVAAVVARAWERWEREGPKKEAVKTGGGGASERNGNGVDNGIHPL